jgi:hypothetical protein
MRGNRTIRAVAGHGDNVGAARRKDDVVGLTMASSNRLMPWLWELGEFCGGRLAVVRPIFRRG